MIFFVVMQGLYVHNSRAEGAQRGSFQLYNNIPVADSLDQWNASDTAKYFVKAGRYTTVAVRSEIGSNVDLAIYLDENLTSFVGGSYLPIGVDFRVENGHNRTNDTAMYALVSSNLTYQTQNYMIESDYNHNLSIGVKSYESMSENEVVDTFDVFLYAGTSYTINLPSFPTGAQYRTYLCIGYCSGSGGFLASGNQSTVMTYVPVTSAWYAVIVTNENNMQGDYQVLVNGGTFNMSAQPRQRTILAGNSGEFNVSVSSIGGFAAEVNLAVEWPGPTGAPPEGVSSAFSNFAITPPGLAILTIFAASNAQSRSYNITIRGVAAGISKSTWAIVTIVATVNHLYNDIPMNGTVDYGEAYDKYSFDAFSPYYTAVAARAGAISRLDVFENEALSERIGYSISFGGIAYYVIDGHLLDSSAKYYATVRSPLGGSFPYFIEADSQGHLALGTTTGGRLGFGEIVETYDMFLDAGYTYIINVSRPIGYNASYDVYLHGGSGPRGSSIASGSSDTPIVVTPQTSGWYGIVVVNTPGIYANYTIRADMLAMHPDFSVAIVPQSNSAVPSGVVEYEVMITAKNGFASAVAFTTVGLPSGCYATFSPSEVVGDGTTTMRIYTSGSTPIGSYTILVNCTSGIIFHEAHATLIVTGAPDFTISAFPITVSASPGTSPEFFVSLTSLNGFDDLVALSTVGLPWFLLPGVGFTPGLVTPTGSSVLTIAINQNVPPGTYQFSISGRQIMNGTQIVHSTTVTLVVTAMQDFTISVAPSSINVPKWRYANYSANIVALNGFDSPVTLAVSGVPQGAYCTIASNPAYPSPQTTIPLSIYTGSASAGTYTLTIKGEGAGNAHYATFELIIVDGPDFSISISPSEAIVELYGLAVFSLVITPLNGFNAPVYLSASGLPFDAYAAFSNNPAYPGSILLNISTGGMNGNFVVTITAESDYSITHTTTLDLAIVRNITRLHDDIPVSDSVGFYSTDRYELNASRNYTAIVEMSTGQSRLEIFDDPFMAVPVAASGNEVWDMYIIDGTSFDHEKEFYATVSAGFMPASYTIEEDTNGVLYVNVPEYAFMHSPDIVEMYTVYLTAGVLYGVTVSNLTGNASYVVALFKGSGMFDSSLARIVAPQKLLFTPAQSGYYGIMVLNMNNVSSSYEILVDTPQDFSISATPMQVTVAPGSYAGFYVAVASINGWSHIVNLETPSLPPQVTSMFMPDYVTPSPIGYSNLSLYVSPTATPGTYEVIIRGNALGIRHQCVVMLIVASAPDFGMSAYPSYREIKAGSQGTFNISVYPLNGFSSSVAISVIGIPPGVAYTITPQSAVPSALFVLRIFANSDAPIGEFAITVVGTSYSPSISHSITVVVRITEGPSMTISATPGQLTILPGGSANVTIFVVTPTGISAPTSLVVTGAPANMMCALNTTIVVPNATVKLSISTTAYVLPGTYSITIAGNSSGITSYCVITVNVRPPPDFRIELSPASGTCYPGGLAVFDVTLVPLNGFTGTASLSIQGMHATMSFTSTNMTLKPNVPEHVTLSTTALTPVGAYYLTVIGTEGSMLPVVHAHNATYVLTVTSLPDFMLALTPTSLVVLPGNSCQCVVTVSALNSFSGTVVLSVAGLPAGASGSFSSPSVIPNATATLTIVAGPSTHQGTYSLLVTGNSSGKLHTVNLTLVVAGVPGFEVSATVSVANVQAGQSASYLISIVSLNGFSEQVNLAIQGLPPGCAAQFSPVSVTPTGQSTLTIQTALATPHEVYVLTVFGSGGGLQDNTTVILNVSQGPDFNLNAVPPENSTFPGGNVTFDVYIVPENGFALPVMLSTEGTLPVGITCVLQPTAVMPGNYSTMKVSVAATVPLGNYLITIIGNGGGIAHEVNVTVHVAIPPTFTLTASPGLADVSPGSVAIFTISAHPSGGFSGAINLTLSSPGASGAGITMILNTTTIGPNGQALLTVTTALATPAGNYVISIIGKSGALVYTTNVTLRVTVEPSYTLSITPTTITSHPGGYANYSIAVTGMNGYSATVSLSASVPLGSTATIAPQSVVPNATALLVVHVVATAPGTYPINVTGTDQSGIVRKVTSWLVVTPAPTFDIEVNPQSVTVQSGADAVFNVVVISENGFAGPVNLSLGYLFPLPPGFTYEFSPQLVMPTSSAMLTIHTPAGFQSILPTTFYVIGACGGDTASSNLAFVYVTEMPTVSMHPSPDSITLAQGGTATYFVELTSINGYDSNVTIDVYSDVSPAEITITPSVVVPNATAIITIKTEDTTPTGTYDITIRATGPGLPPFVGITSFVTLVVTATPQITLAVSPNEMTVQKGGSAQYDVSVGAIAGFSGATTLSASSSHPSVSVTFGASGLSPPFDTIMTVHTSASTPAGQYIITVRASASGVEEVLDIVYLLVVESPDFALSVTPASAVASTGGYAMYVVEVHALNSFAGRVELSLSSPIAGIHATFVVNPCMPNCSVVFEVYAGAPEGSYALAVVGKNGSMIRTSNEFVIEIVGTPDFSIAISPSALTVEKGSMLAHAGISATPLNGFDGTIFLSAEGLPSGLDAEFSSNELSPGGYYCTVSFSASSFVAAGEYIVTIVCTSGDIERESQIMITIVETPDFSLSAGTYDIKVVKGGDVGTDIFVEGLNGFNASVALECSGAPAGIQVSISPSSVTVNTATGGIAVAKMAVTASSSANAGMYLLVVKGISQGLEHSFQIALNVTSLPGFVVRANESELIAPPGGSVNYTVFVEGMNGFSSTVLLAASGGPDGIEFAFSPQSGTADFSSVLHANVPSSAQDGTYLVVVVGTSGMAIERAIMRLIVSSKPDFIISLSPTSLVVERGESVRFSCTFTTVNGFNETLSYSVAGLPQGTSFAVVSTTQTNNTLECVFEISATEDAEIGTYSLAFAASAPNVSKSAPLSLRITGGIPHDFVLDVSPRNQTLSGNSAKYIIEALWLDGSMSGIVLDAYCNDLGISINLSQKIVTGTNKSILVATVANSVTSGNYTITITGSSEGLLKTMRVLLVVNRSEGSVSFSLEPPKGKSAHGGDVVVYEFVLTNLGETYASFVVSASSREGWKAVVLGGNLTKKLAPREELTIKVKLAVPRGAKGSDELTVAVRTIDGLVEKSSEVKTNVVVEESSVWLLALLALVALIAALVVGFYIYRKMRSSKGFVEIKPGKDELKDADMRSPEQVPASAPAETPTSPATPAPIIAPVSATADGAIAPSTASPPAAAQPASPTRVKCSCGNFIEVTSPERPMRLKCGKCGKEGMLRAKPQTMQSPPAQTPPSTAAAPQAKSNPDLLASIAAIATVNAAQVVSRALPASHAANALAGALARPHKVKCKCGNVIEVTSAERPITIKCNVCGRAGVLKASPQAQPLPVPETRSVPLAQKEASAEIVQAGTTEQPKPVGKVRCSGCSETISIFTRDRPLVVVCPKCGKKGMLR